MNKINKKRIVIGVIAILTIINISGLVTMYYSNKIRTKRIEEFNRFQEQAHKNRMHRYFKDELKLTDEQFKEFLKTNYAYFDKSRKIAHELHEKRYDMMNEIAKNEPDKQKLDKIANDIGNLHYNLKKITIEHFLKLKSICNEEQQVELQKMFMFMVHSQDGEGMMREYGRRGPRPGKHFENHRRDRDSNRR